MQEPRVIHETYPTATKFNLHFDPKKYLFEMFSAPDDEDRFGLTFMARVLKSLPDDLFVHEFGGGPTLYSVAALAPKAREIHFSDVVDASLHEVDLWLKNHEGAHNWDSYLALALEAEGQTVSETRIKERAELIRSRVSQLMRCDAQSTSPIGMQDMQYDLVTAHHCTDVAATTVEEWIQVLKNVTKIVHPGGWLMLSVTTGARTYQVGDVIFQCVSLSPEDIRVGFHLAGYQANSIILETYELEGSQEYSGIVMAIAQLDRDKI